MESKPTKGATNEATKADVPKKFEKKLSQGTTHEEDQHSDPTHEGRLPSVRCFFPVPAFRDPEGQVRPGHYESGPAHHEELQLRCGRCMGCRIHKKQQWTTRMLLELATHDQACFITMTYEEDGSLETADWQNFAKRLRKKCGPFRYYQCGEYGDKTERRHHHAVLFGLDLNDRDDRHYPKRELLRTTWGHGHTDVGDATPASIGYVAGYVTKKLTGPKERLYDHVDSSTGEVLRRKPPFATMSRRPGLGEPYYRLWKDQIYPRDEIVLNGVIRRPPEYFDLLYEREHPNEFADIKAKRQASAEKFYSEDTPQKRQAGETIAQAKQAMRKGELHS